MKITKNNIKGLSFLRLCEAVNNGEPIEGLDEFASESQDADFTEDATVEETEGAEETEAETEESESDTVTVEISKGASLPEVLRAVAAALEGEEEVEDDAADKSTEDESGEEESTEEEYVEDDTEEETEEDCESATKPLASEDEESVADTDTAMKTAGTKETKRTKQTPAINRKGTLDAAKLGDIVKEEGDAAVVKPTERKKGTPAINRSKVATSRLNPGKRLTDVGKGK